MKVIVLEGRGAAGAERHAQQPGIEPPKFSERLFRIRRTGQSSRCVAVENRIGHGRDQRFGAIVYFVDIACDRNVGARGHSSGRK